MKYLKPVTTFLTKSPKQAALVLGLDLLFYFLFLPIGMLFLRMLEQQLYKLPLNAMAQFLSTTQGTLELQRIMLNILFGIISTILLFILLCLLNFAIVKIFIWHVIEKKKIKPIILFKSFVLTFLLVIIFMVPFFISVQPFVLGYQQFLETQIQPQPSPIDFLGFGIVSLLLIYFSTLGYYFLTKTHSLKKAIKELAVQGCKRIHKLGLPFAILFVILLIIPLIIQLGQTNLLIMLILIIIFSFVNRLSLSKAI